MTSAARRGMLAGLLAVLALGVVLMGLAMRGGPAGASSPLVGSPAPALAGRTLDGPHFTLAGKPGILTVVNVWASWCGPCRDELPLIRDVARDRSGRVRVVTVNTRDGPVAARALLHQVGAQDLLTVLDPTGDIAVRWGATGVPETFVVDGHGVVRARRVGVVTAAWLRDELARWEGS